MYVHCEHLSCRNNYDCDCLEIARRPLELNSTGTCLSFEDKYAEVPADPVEKILTRVSKLLRSQENKLRNIEDTDERLTIQGNINALEVVIRIINEEKGEENDK